MKNILILISLFLLSFFQSCDLNENDDKKGEPYDLFYPGTPTLSYLESNCEIEYEGYPMRYKCETDKGATWYYDFDQDENVLLSEIVEISTKNHYNNLDSIKNFIESNQDISSLGQFQLLENGYTLCVSNIYSNRIFRCFLDKEESLFKIVYDYPRSYDYRPLLVGRSLSKANAQK